MEKYIEQHRIACYRSDSHWEMRPESFLDMAQQIAVKGAQLLSFNDEALKALGCVWVLARMQVIFEKPVPFDKLVTLKTWHKGQCGPYFLRDYSLEQDGEEVVRSTSSWIVMNMESRRISRDEAVMKLLEVSAQSPDHAIETPCPKVMVPRDTELKAMGSDVVRYSDIDKNGHANNVKYTVWALDNLPQDLVMNHPVKELVINFNREALPGEEVILYHAEIDGAHIIEGRASQTLGDGSTAEHQVFIEKLVFA